MAAFKLTKVQRTELEIAIGAFERAKGDLYDKLQEIADEWNDAFSERSDRWQEGENGEAARERIDAIETMRDELENVEVPEISSLDS